MAKKNYKPTTAPRSIPDVQKKEKTPVKFHKDLKLLAKRANQAMVRLERLDINSPAYEYAQAVLEMLGKERKGNRGRRFSETGKATYNEYEMLISRLNRFLNMPTHSEKGAKAWVDKIWEGALKSDKVNISEANITRDEYLEFWKAMPAAQQDRMLGSEIIVNIIQTVSLKKDELRKSGQMTPELENKLSPQEIANAIQSSRNMKAAFKKLGITSKEYMSVKKLGKLPEKKRKRRK